MFTRDESCVPLIVAEKDDGRVDPIRRRVEARVREIDLDFVDILAAIRQQARDDLLCWVESKLLQHLGSSKSIGITGRDSVDPQYWEHGCAFVYDQGSQDKLAPGGAGGGSKRSRGAFVMAEAAEQRTKRSIWTGATGKTEEEDEVSSRRRET